ncbi:MAG: PAS domain-containing sensor histidine kinase, partial [Desulfovibrionaceae bacterium]
NQAFKDRYDPMSPAPAAACFQTLQAGRKDCEHCPARQAMVLAAPQQKQVRLTAADGAREDVLARAAPVVADGETLGVFLVLGEPPQPRDLEARLELREFLLDLVSDPVCLVDCAGVYVWANQAYLDAAGQTAESLPGSTPQDVWGEQAGLERLQPRLEVCRLGRESFGESTFAFPHGPPRQYEVRLAPFPASSSEQASAAFVGAVHHDVTEQRQAQRQAVKHGERLSHMVDSISAILIALDASDRVTHWNAAAARAFGLRVESAIGASLLELDIGWPVQVLAEKLVECRQTDAAVRVESLPHSRPDGQDGALGLTLNPVPGSQTGERDVLILGSDITDIQARRMRMVKEQKMQSIGQLAAGIVHEISTPARFVSNNIRFLEEGFDDLLALLVAYEDLSARLREGRDPGELIRSIENLAQEADLGFLLKEIPPALSQSLRGMERVSHILQTIKQFSHPGATEKRPVDVNQALENTCMITRSEWKHSSELAMELEPGLPSVMAMPVELNQALLNVVLNAAQANDQAKRQGAGRGEISIATRLAENLESVEVRISDTGPGVAAAEADKIFLPFYTTKAPGQGTGQGLAITRSIIEVQHGGSIAVEDRPGGGASFVITLPLGYEPV